jgi:hypothetical protein
MRFARYRPFVNIQLLDLTPNDMLNIESNYSLDTFSKGLGAYGPTRREPARRAFHSHPEFRQA